MQRIIPLLFLLSACNLHEEKHEPFPLPTIPDNQWTTYEGKWLTEEGIVRVELSLKTGPFGIDSDFKLGESTELNSKAFGSFSKGKYTVLYGLPNNEVGIVINNLGAKTKSFHFRHKESSQFDMSEEMFFLTRGDGELLPCDRNFNPITTDPRFGLHKILDKFTVEGYVTFESDKALFFEQNTGVEWRLANLGEYDEVKTKYEELVKEKFEGIYVRALAYSTPDAVSGKAIVIKRIIVIGDQQY
jgi:hypothetical protein